MSDRWLDTYDGGKDALDQLQDIFGDTGWDVECAGLAFTGAFNHECSMQAKRDAFLEVARLVNYPDIEGLTREIHNNV